MHEVKKATYLDDYKILIEFSNKKTKVVDFKTALNNFTGQVFKPLKNIDYFKAFRISEGIATLEWDNGADIAPEFLYEIGVEIKRSPRPRIPKHRNKSQSALKNRMKTVKPLYKS